MKFRPFYYILFPFLLISLFFSIIAYAAPYTPESILPDGVNATVSINPYTGESGDARKGTVAATLNNIAMLNQLFAQPMTVENHQQIEEITQAVRHLLPSLRVIGMFDLFTVEEWIGQGMQLGRLYVALLYLEAYPQALTPSVQQALTAIYIANQTQLSSVLENQFKKIGISPRH